MAVMTGRAVPTSKWVEEQVADAGLSAFDSLL
jgi:hypothetical protein